MNFEQNTGKSIQRAFNEFHKKNPKVYEHFKKLVGEAVMKGKTKVSAKLIINVIRWEVYMETIELTLFTTSTGDLKTFRINDAYTSRYARVYCEEFPKRAHMFEKRELRS